MAKSYSSLKCKSNEGFGESNLELKLNPLNSIRFTWVYSLNSNITPSSTTIYLWGRVYLLRPYY